VRTGVMMPSFTAPGLLGLEVDLGAQESVDTRSQTSRITSAIMTA
jgi:hypothetical protein